MLRLTWKVDKKNKGRSPMKKEKIDPMEKKAEARGRMEPSEGALLCNNKTLPGNTILQHEQIDPGKELANTDGTLPAEWAALHHAHGRIQDPERGIHVGGSGHE